MAAGESSMAPISGKWISKWRNRWAVHPATTNRVSPGASKKSIPAGNRSTRVHVLYTFSEFLILLCLRCNYWSHSLYDHQGTYLMVWWPSAQDRAFERVSTPNWSIFEFDSRYWSAECRVPLHVHCCTGHTWRTRSCWPPIRCSMSQFLSRSALLPYKILPTPTNNTVRNTLFIFTS